MGGPRPEAARPTTSAPQSSHRDRMAATSSSRPSLSLPARAATSGWPEAATSGASSSQFQATSAEKPTEPTAKSGLSTGAPPSSNTRFATRRTLSAFQPSRSNGGEENGVVAQPSQRALSSHPVSHGWKTGTSPFPLRGRSSRRWTRPRVARSSSPSLIAPPPAAISLSARPHIGGWVIDEVRDRPHIPAWASGSLQ